MNIPIEKSIDLQKLYELWLKKSEWSLLDEAIPLLYGHAPTGPGESANQKPDKSMQLLLEKSVREGTLRLESGEEELSGARVKPEHIYSWAVKQKIAIPPEFSALMDFILKTVINESLEEELPERDASESSLSGNEKVLGACLALLAKYGDDCRGKAERYLWKNYCDLWIRKGKNYSEEMSHNYHRCLSGMWFRNGYKN